MQLPFCLGVQDTFPSTIKSTVRLLDLKPHYDKGQSRRKANSEQRLLDAEVHMIADLAKPLQVKGLVLFMI